MTTLAYKDGVLAYDSRRTAGSIIISDSIDKLQSRDGVLFLLSGSTPDFPAFIDSYLGNVSSKTLDVDGYVIDSGKLWLASFCGQTGFWKQEMDPAVPHALGSGREFALAALDMGADAVKAVEVAKGRDIYTGGLVRTYKLA